MWVRACFDYGPRQVVGLLTLDLLQCCGPAVRVSHRAAGTCSGYASADAAHSHHALHNYAPHQPTPPWAGTAVGHAHIESSAADGSPCATARPAVCLYTLLAA